jgi:hypothetical protein
MEPPGGGNCPDQFWTCLPFTGQIRERSVAKGINLFIGVRDQSKGW